PAQRKRNSNHRERASASQQHFLSRSQHRQSPRLCGTPCFEVWTRICAADLRVPEQNLRDDLPHLLLREPSLLLLRPSLLLCAGLLWVGIQSLVRTCLLHVGLGTVVSAV